MPPKKNPAPTEVVYHGGSDGVVIHLPEAGAVEFVHGVPVVVSAKDAKSLAARPDFQPTAPKATTNPSEEG